MSAADTNFRILASPGFPEWLVRHRTSLAFSTYQIGKLFFVGTKPEGRLSVFERTFDRCLGLWTDTQTLWLASAFQLWRLENALETGIATDDGYDRLFVPRCAYTTGEIDLHDVSVDAQDQPLMVNTLFSCLATVCPRYSFQELWRPPFIQRLAPEDACHLNGLACEAGQPRYVTACAATGEPSGWRSQRDSGGVVIDVASNEIVSRGLSMPHAPRLYRGQLWVLNSGVGDFCRVDLRTGQLERVAFCPGYARGLTFINHCAIIGLSRPREATFAGLALDEQLRHHGQAARCGLIVVDLDTGKTIESLEIEGRVEELYDVVTLPGVSRPMALGLKTDEIRRNAWALDHGQLRRWTAVSKS